MSKVEFLNIAAFVTSTSGCLNAFAAGIRYFHAKKANRTIAPALLLMIVALAFTYGSIAIVQL
jgi:hypothetical protein